MEGWLHNSFKDQTDPTRNMDDEALGARLARELQEDLQEERIRLSGIESQRIAEERRIWRKNKPGE